MKFVFRLNFLFLFSLMFVNGISQSNHHNEKTKVYYYTFSGSSNKDDIELMKEEIARMQFVTEVKIEYKGDRKYGQIRLVAKEYYTNKDTDYEFNIYNLKMFLINRNLMPGEYRSEVISQ